MLPIGAAINCDGIPVYEAVATMFVAQMHEDVGMVLNAPTIINIVLTVLAASIGAANVTNTGWYHLSTYHHLENTVKQV